MIQRMKDLFSRKWLLSGGGNSVGIAFASLLKRDLTLKKRK